MGRRFWIPTHAGIQDQPSIHPGHYLYDSAVIASIVAIQQQLRYGLIGLFYERPTAESLRPV